eukprot:1109182_1
MAQGLNEYKQRYDQLCIEINSAQSEQQWQIELLSERHTELQEQAQQSEAKLRKWKNCLQETEQKMKQKNRVLADNKQVQEHLNKLKEQKLRTKQTNLELIEENGKLANQVNQLLDE